MESDNTELKEKKYLFLSIACIVSIVNWIDVVYFTDYNSKSFTIGLPYFYHLTLLLILVALIKKERPWILYLIPFIVINFSYSAMEMFMGIAIVAVLSLPIYTFVHFKEIKNFKKKELKEEPPNEIKIDLVQEKSKFMFLLWANILAALNWLVFCSLVLDTKAEGPTGLAVVFTVPVLLGSAYLLMVVAFIRGERPIWAYLTILLSPIIVIAAVSSSISRSDTPEVLVAALVISGIGVLLLGFGKIIQMLFIDRYDARAVDTDQRITTDETRSRFIIKSTMVISIANGFFTLIFIKDEFGEIIVSLLGVLTLITLFLLLVSKIKSENPSFIEVLFSNASLLASLSASAYYEVWIMFWLIIMVLFIIEPVIWILFKYKIKIWISIIISAITLTCIAFIVYSIIEYSEHKSREKTEERYRKWDLEYLQRFKLEDNWVMFLPAGYKINVPIKYLGDFKFKIEGKIFDAEYEKDFLKYFEDKHSSIEWQIIDKDSLLLRDYHCSGVVMVRGDKLLKMKEIPELNLSGEWLKILPGGYKRNTKISYIGDLKYKIDGEVFNVDFVNCSLDNHQDKNNNLNWKIGDKDSLVLINSDYKGSILIRGEKIQKNIPKPPEPDLTGNWELIMPTGYKYDAELEYLGKMKYNIASKQYLGGSNYEFTGKELKMEENQSNPWDHYIWRIENKDYMILIETPLEKEYRNNYCGAILKRKGSKNNTTLPPSPDLRGRWNLTTPKGYTYNVPVEYLGDSLYRILWSGDIGGVYEIGKNGLAMFNPSGAAEREYRWKVLGADSLILATVPAEGKNNKNYLKSMLIRSNKKISSDIKKLPKLEGEWNLHIPPNYNYIIRIEKSGDYHYRITGTKDLAVNGNYQFIEDELIINPDNSYGKEFVWKIESEDKLILIKGEYPGSTMEKR